MPRSVRALSRAMARAISAVCRPLVSSSVRTCHHPIEKLEERRLLAAVTGKQFDFQGTSQSVKFTFDTAMTGVLQPGDFVLRDELRDEVIDSNYLNVTTSADGKTYTVDWLALPADGATPGGDHPAQILADGWYSAAVSHPSLTGSGSSLTLNFAFLRGDANGDLRVEFNDLLLLAQNYNQGSNKTYGQGDFDYDGDVDFNDLLTLAQRYNGDMVMPPNGPNQLTVSDSRAHSLTLRWTSPSDATGFTGFNVYRKRHGEASYSLIPDLVINREEGKTNYQYIDNSLWDGSRYYYYVRPFNTDPNNGFPLGEWAKTQSKSAVTVMPSPEDLSITDVTAHGGVLSWTDTSKREDSYVIYRSIDGGPAEVYNIVAGRDGAGGIMSLDMTGLSPGTHYSFTVEGANSGTTSARSAPVAFVTPSVTSTPLSITGPESVSAGDRASFTASGGNTVSGNNPINYIWEVQHDNAVVANGDGASFDFVPLDGGTHLVRVVAIQQGGGVQATERLLQVSPPKTEYGSLVGPQDAELNRSSVYRVDLNWTDELEHAHNKDLDDVDNKYDPWEYKWTATQGATTISTTNDMFSFLFKPPTIGLWTIKFELSGPTPGLVFRGSKQVFVAEGAPDPFLKREYDVNTAADSNTWVSELLEDPISGNLFAITYNEEAKRDVGDNIDDVWFQIVKYNPDTLQPDPSFGEGGAASIRLANDYFSYVGEASAWWDDGVPHVHILQAAFQPDGSIIVAAAATKRLTGQDPDKRAGWLVTRVSRNGLIDGAFGAGGYVFVDPSDYPGYGPTTGGLDFPTNGAGPTSLLGALAVQGDGRILLAGASLESQLVNDNRLIDEGESPFQDRYNFCIARLNGDGSLDDGSVVDSSQGDEFGNGGVVVHAIVPEADRSFELYGRVTTTPFWEPAEIVTQLRFVNSNGQQKILAVGPVVSGPGWTGTGDEASGLGIGLLQLNDDGSLDTSTDVTPGDGGFGPGGTGSNYIRFVDESEFDHVLSNMHVTDIEVTKAGDVLAFGSAQHRGTQLVAPFPGISKPIAHGGGGWPEHHIVQSFVLKFTPTGVLDSSFGSDPLFPGVALIPSFYASSDAFWSGFTDSTGRIIVAGSSLNGGLVARLDSNGIVDATFGNAGRIVVGGTETGLIGNAEWFYTRQSLNDNTIILSGMSTRWNIGGPGEDDTPAERRAVIAKYRLSDPTIGQILSASVAIDGSVDLRWEDKGFGEVGFAIRRATSLSDLSTPNAERILVGPDTTAYNDRSVRPNTTYFYKVEVLSETGAAGQTNAANVTTPPINTGFRVQDSVSVSLLGEDSATHIELLPDSVYKLEARGYFDLSWNYPNNPFTWLAADAEYAHDLRQLIDPLDRTIFNGVDADLGIAARLPGVGETFAPGETRGSSVRSTPVSAQKFPYWGQPSTDARHTYNRIFSLDQLGGTVPSQLIFRYLDNYYPDNAPGTAPDRYPLTVDIYRAVPSAPGNLVAAGEHHEKRVTLNWTITSTDADRYIVERAGSNGVYSKIAVLAGNATRYTDTDVAFNTPYYYRVSAENEFAASGKSNIAPTIIVNRAPIITAQPTMIARRNEEYRFHVEAVDPEYPEDGADQLRYALISGPTGAKPVVTDPTDPSTGATTDGLISGWIPTSLVGDDGSPLRATFVVRVWERQRDDASPAYTDHTFQASVQPQLATIPYVTQLAREDSRSGDQKQVVLKVQGGDDDNGEPNLTYTWTPLAWPATAGRPTFSQSNGTNAAKTITATIGGAGTYRFRATISDGTTWTATSDTNNVVITAEQTSIAINLPPGTSGTVSPEGKVRLAARVRDQFGKPLATQPVIEWLPMDTQLSGESIVATDATGLYADYTAPSPITGQTADLYRTVKAKVRDNAGIPLGTFPITVLPSENAPPVIVDLDVKALNFRQIHLLAVVTDDGLAKDLIYSWSITRPLGSVPITEEPTFSDNQSNSAREVTVTCQANRELSYDVHLTVFDKYGRSDTATFEIRDVRNFSTVRVRPSTTTASVNTPPATTSKVTFTAEALDQYGIPVVDPENATTWEWYVNNSPQTAGVTGATFVWTAPAVPGTYDIRAVAHYKAISQPGSTSIAVVGPQEPVLLINSPSAQRDDLTERLMPAVIEKDTPIAITAYDPNPEDSIAWYLWLIDKSGHRQLLTSGTQAKGVNSNNGEDAYTLRPGLLEDGAYTIGISKANNLASELLDSKQVNIRSKVKLGGLNLPFTDLSYQDQNGNQITITRTYDSTLAKTKGKDFGNGWKLDISESRLETTARPSVTNPTKKVLRFGDLVYATLPNGQQHTFQFLPKPDHYRENGNPLNPLHRNFIGQAYEPNFVAVDGSNARLTLPSGIDVLYYNINHDEFQVGLRGGPALEPSLAGSGLTPNTQEFFVKDDDGSTTTFDATSGKAKHRVDTNGNAVQYSNGLPVLDGVSIDIVRDVSSGPAQGLVKEIHIRKGGRDVVPPVFYHYHDPAIINESDVPFLRATADSIGNLTRYDYGTGVDDQYLVAVRDPTGQKIVDVSYVPATHEVAALRNYASKGSQIASTPLTTSGTRRTTTDALGNTTEYVYNEQGDVEREIKGIRNSAGTVVKYLVTAHRFDYYDGEQSISDDVYLGVSALNRLWQTVDYPTYEVPAPDTGGTRYGAPPVLASVIRKWVQFDPSDPDKKDVGMLQSESVRSSNGQYRITEYSLYDDDKPQKVTSYVATSSSGAGKAATTETSTYFKYDEWGNLSWTIGVDGTGTRNVYVTPSSPEAATLPKGLVLKAYRIRQTGTDAATGLPTWADVDANPISENGYYANNDNARIGARSQIAWTKSETGQVTSYAYDDAGRTVATATLWTNPGHPSRWIVNKTNFNAVGQAINTETITYYDGSPGNASMADGVLNWSVNATTGVASITEPQAWSGEPTLAAARVTSRTYYDTLGRPSVTLDEVNSNLTTGRKATVTTYDAAGQTFRTFYPDGTESRLAYDDAGRLIATMDRFASTPPTIAFNDATGTATVTLPTVNNTTLTNVARTLFDSAGRSIGTERYKDASIKVDVDGITGKLRSFTPSFTALQLNGQRLSTASTYFDDRGRVVETVAIDGSRTGTLYWEDGRVHITGVLKPITHPDAPADWWRLLNAENAFETLTAYEYDEVVASGSISTIPDAVLYDLTTSDTGIETRTFKDIQGRVVGTDVRNTGITPVVTRTFFGKLDTPLPPTNSVVDINTLPGFVPSAFKGQHVVEFDAMNRQTHRLLDRQGRLTDIWLPPIDDATTVSSALVWSHWRYTYDANGNQASQVDPRGKVTSFTYDDHGRRLSRTLPADGDGNTANDTERWTYDTYGRVLTHVDFKGQTTKSVYDNLNGGRLLEAHRFNAADDGSPDEKTAYGYDTLGRQNVVKEFTGGNVADGQETRTETTAFDPITGQLSSITTPEGTVNYQYDASTNRLMSTWTADNERQYVYDNRGRLSKVVVLKLNGQTTTLSETSVYDPAGRVDLKINDNGTTATSDDVTTDYVYDGLGGLDQTHVRRGAAVNGGAATGGSLIFSQDFILRKDGQRMSAVETRDDGSTATTSWEYDDQGRLNREQRVGSNAFVHEFGFDLSGNRVWKKIDGVQTTNVYNDRNQLIGEDANNNSSINDAVDTRYTYDANGATETTTTNGVTSRNKWSLTQRLTSIDNNDNGSLTDAGDVAYTYDVNGVRVTKLVAGTGLIVYLDDPKNFTGFSKPIEEKSSLNGTAVLSYVYGTDVIAQLSGTDVSQAKMLIHDGRGYTRSLVATTGSILERNNYTAFGTILGGGTSTTPWQSPDGYRDNETGAFYHLERYREEDRFISQDPTMFGAGDVLDANLYGFGAGNPMMYTDASGLMSLGEQIVTAGVKGGLLSMLLGAPFRAYKAGKDVYAGASFLSVAMDFFAGVATDFAIGAVLGGGASGLVRALGSNAFKIRAAGQSIGKFLSLRLPWSSWNLAASARGFAIEKTILSRAAGFFGKQVRNFPVIDDYIIKGGRGIATSIKSIDLTLPSYTNPAAIVSKLNGYADRLARFAVNGAESYGGVTIGNSTAPVADRVLIVAIEEGAANSSQATAMIQWVREAATKYPNIKILVQPIP
jgi:RHS repeat-associated protein/uncharacterized delta-60 repeat protein